jgi:hypothetical protein
VLLANIHDFGVSTLERYLVYAVAPTAWVVIARYNKWP